MAARSSAQAFTFTESVAKAQTGGGFLAELVFEDGGAAPPIIHQRIYDSGLSQYVYYTKSTSDPAPAAGETAPNHSGSLVTATHETL